MTNLVAALLAMAVGWAIDALCRPHLGTGVTLILSFVVSTIVFFVARNWLNELRNG